MSRKAEIARVLSKYGFDWLGRSQSPWRVIALPRQWAGKERPGSQPAQVRQALEELGTTYIKLGQMISTRTDLVPREYVNELSKLQDNAPEVPYEEVARVIREELGASPELIFKSFERTPLAAASIGQVHQAELVDGRKVVVKVQRPGAEELVEDDLRVLEELATVLSSLPKLASYDVKGLLEEFAFTIRNELDYRREGRNADRFRINFAGDAALKVPIVHWDTTTRRVLTMEEIEGFKVTETEALDEAGLDRKRLANEASRIVLNEIFRYGLFHADPHAGNFFVQTNGVLGLIDFGMVGRLDRAEQESLMRMTLALAYQDVDTLIDELLTLGVERKPISRQQLRAEISRQLQLHLDAPPEEFSIAQMFQDTLHMAARHNIQIPSDMLFLARALAMCEGLAKILDPNYPMMEATRNHLERIYRERYSPENLSDRARESYIEIGEFALDLPRRTRRLFGQLERGEVTFTARLADTNELLEHFHRAVNRLSLSVLVAGVIAGLSVLTLRLRPDQGVWSAWVNVLLFLVIATGIFLIVSIWKARKT